MSRITLHISEKHFSKDPLTSELGRKIIHEGIYLLDTLGFEQFTFRKLAHRIDSSEASIYRYFENKQRLLTYLINWYWTWVDYMIDYHTHHIDNRSERLERMWEIVCHFNVSHPDEVMLDISKLRRIVVNESEKTFLTKEVDENNQEGLFKGFKTLCNRIAALMLEIQPEYPYARSLASTMVEAAHQQAFFANHLPSLTSVVKQSDAELNEQVARFITTTVNQLINKPTT